MQEKNSPARLEGSAGPGGGNGNDDNSPEPARQANSHADQVAGSLGDCVRATGLYGLDSTSPLDAVEAVLGELAALVGELKGDDADLVRDEAVKVLRAAGRPRPSRLVDMYTRTRSASNGGNSEDDLSGRALFIDPEPCEELVGGALLLSQISGWLRAYVWLPQEAADAIALWSAATWFVAEFYFAVILLLSSATKRCGKTLLLDLLRPIVRRGYQTSAVGVTAPVVFRLNQAEQPTFLIDEAEKLGGRNADRELIGMFNVGYRRGSYVSRCVDVGGDYEVRRFSAFGFRALAAVGSLWDTLMDRAVVVQMERKPSSAAVEPFNGRQVASEGELIARQLSRWSLDNATAVEDAASKAPRPTWMHDRDCDNWSSLFAVAQVAGGDWPARAASAARAIAASEEARDFGELLVHDIRGIFEAAGRPEVIKSGDLCTKLNAIETSPWGDYRKGDGYNAHKLAVALKPFGIVPQQGRRDGGAGQPVRGYWRSDLQPAFDRYPPAAEVVQAGHPSNDEGFQDLESGTVDSACTTSQTARKPDRAGDVPLVPLTEGGARGGIPSKRNDVRNESPDELVPLFERARAAGRGIDDARGNQKYSTWISQRIAEGFESRDEAERFAGLVEEMCHDAQGAGP
jgi:hypothetical protein